MAKSPFLYLSLIGINLIYACTSVCTKLASKQAVMSWPYVLWVIGAIVVLGVYAMLWQQVIRKMPISSAYMFKGTSLVFILLFSALLFGESITWTNIIGSVIIISGIVLFAKA